MKTFSPGWFLDQLKDFLFRPQGSYSFLEILMVAKRSGYCASSDRGFTGENKKILSAKRKWNIFFFRDLEGPQFSEDNCLLKPNCQQKPNFICAYVLSKFGTTKILNIHTSAIATSLLNSTENTTNLVSISTQRKKKKENLVSGNVGCGWRKKFHPGRRKKIFFDEFNWTF